MGKTKAKNIIQEPLSKVSEIVQKIVEKDIVVENAKETRVETSAVETSSPPSAAKPDEKVAEKTKLENSVHSKSTLFVSTIPFDATNNDLEEFFSEVGPIRNCFLIKKDGKSTGCGYVQFALAEDAEKAMKSLKKKKFNGKRTLKIKLAIKKSIVEERKKAGLPLDIEAKNAKELLQVKKSIKVIPEGPGKLPKKSLYRKVENSVTIQITNLPDDLTRQVLNKKVRKFGIVKEIIMDGDFNVSKKATVVYDTPSEAKNAVQHLHDHTYKGVKISCQVVETVTAASIAKKARLIIRNLAFSCKKENLVSVFSPFGAIVDCNVPLIEGKSRGFGFVQFDTVENAGKAMEAINGQKILSRPVAVDWALGKSQYEILAAEESESDDDEDEGDESIEAGVDEAEADDAEADERVESASESEANDQEESDNDEAIIYSGDDESDVEHESEPVVQKPRPKQTLEQDSTLFVRNLSFDSTKQTLKKLFETWGDLVYAVITIDKISGISRGNGFVAFKSAENAAKCLKDYDEALQASQLAGFSYAAEQAPDTNSSVKPSLPELSNPAIEMFTLDGRFLNVTLALSRDTAQKINQASNLSRRASDKRHLYLMREGTIIPGSEAAQSLTPAELEHRTAQFANRKRLLATNPNLFISRTRLSIRGLPPRITDTDLRNAVRASVKEFWKDVANSRREGLEAEVVEEELEEGHAKPGPERKICIKQAKIIRETDRIDPITKKAKSKGYGFIEFSSHADALACLRVMNNDNQIFATAKSSDKAPNETVKSKTKRLVLEFAIENQLVLKKRKERINQQKSNDKKRTRDDQTTSKKRSREDSSDPSKKKVKTDESKAKTEKSGKKKGATFKERREIRKAKENEKFQKVPVDNQKPEIKPAAKSVIAQKADRKTTPKTSLRPEKQKNAGVSKKSQKEEASFQSLVSSYTKKLIVNAAAPQEKSAKKWYE